VEDTFDKEWAKKLGVNTDELVISQSAIGEDTLELLIKLLEAEPAVIVVDSVAALITRAELEEDVEKAFMAPKARLMSKALAKINALNKKTLIIFINQLRATMAMYGPQFTTPGGNSLRHYSSIRLEIKKTEDIHEENKKTKPIIGQIIGFKTSKNKTFMPQQIGSFKFFYDGHIE
jgi:recombination protein RecA